MAQKEDMVKGLPFDPACLACGTNCNLRMVANRDEKMRMVGWIFVCEKHFPAVAEKRVQISLSE